jgi:hypothetical protein
LSVQGEPAEDQGRPRATPTAIQRRERQTLRIAAAVRNTLLSRPARRDVICGRLVAHGVPLKDAGRVVDLEALISLAPGQTDALDRFVGTCLTDAGLWESPRTSDGISDIVRVVERSPQRLRVSGRIWSIDQVLHTFWLELQRAPSGDDMIWCLYFDIAESSPRRTRNALDDQDRPPGVPLARHARRGGDDPRPRALAGAGLDAMDRARHAVTPPKRRTARVRRAVVTSDQ